jgi:hypothetical protein
MLCWENRRGGVFWPAKCEIEPYRLGFGPWCANQDESARGSVGGTEYTVVNEVRGLLQKHRLGQSIWPAKPKMGLRGLNFRLGCMKQSASGVWEV